MKLLTKSLAFALVVFSIVFISSCDEDGGISLFTIEDDKRLGQQVAEEIAANPQEYPILSETQYAQSYSYLRGILNKILSSSEIRYREEFAYDQIKIIQNDEVLNAFATPGGYIYVYTGLIKFLETEDHLAGVIGHEIAHAERRHSSKALQRQMGIQLLLDIVLGNNQGAVSQVLVNIGSLKFSRDAETEADESAVLYLGDTQYQCNGVAGFFEKLESESGARVPEFLSTHPSPGNRVENINTQASSLGCNTNASNPSSYQDFKNSLP